MSWSESIANPAVIAGARVAGVLIVAFLLTRILRRGVTKVESKVSQDTTPLRHLQRTETLAKVVSSAGIVVIWSIASIYIIRELGFDLAPLLAGIGVLGLAIGFGAQNLVRDVVNGFFILLEDQYGVGDFVEINQVASGKVEQLTLRVTGLRALDGTMHFIANGNITHVANRSKDWARAIIDVGVAYKEDPARVREVLEEVAEGVSNNGEQVGRKLYGAPEVLGVEMLGEYEVVWRMMADTKPGKQWEVARQLREKIKIAFDEKGIEIPYPHQVTIAAEGSAASGNGADD
jgi:moderate conductance mechanosensitive channel